ncbi:hypothetical protein [Miltoncostaea oceani]|uniref:hypothetical protein n=1 Tax=Miltoncostaea oceani TaxID=2843216 RepID=UPI001C3DD9CD|nr:hypothetical protein [Miltoncostaea oceani]
MEPPVVTVRAPDGTRLADVTVEGGHARIDPPDAASHPLVAAVAGQMERTATRPRPRPSC